MLNDLIHCATYPSVASAESETNDAGIRAPWLTTIQIPLTSMQSDRDIRGSNR